MKTFLKVCAFMIATFLQVGWIAGGCNLTGIFVVGLWTAIEISIIINYVKHVQVEKRSKES